MYDLIVIGGGVNGVGIARDAAGRGLSVCLLEKNDLASATSSSSTKLIHGGLRYLEQYDFKLVADSLNERERLLHAAPHLIWPLKFILPHESHLRPAWMIRIGLFLYDSLGKRNVLMASKSVNFKKDISGTPLKKKYKKGFSYADCWVDDARLVVLCAKDAEAFGADIRTRTACTSLLVKSDGAIWEVEAEDQITGKSETLHAKCVVNAAGPWVRNFLDDNDLVTSDTYQTRYSKGSHIIVKKLYEGDHAYILQQEDNRIIFAIPYEQNFTLIGTTDSIYEGDPSNVKISKDEIEYLCSAINRSFEHEISPDDVVWSYSGVRPLLDSGDENLSKVTRDYKFNLEEIFGPPILNVFGGKMTTFRKLSSQAVDLIAGYFDNIQPSWTDGARIYGGAIEHDDFDAFLAEKQKKYPWLNPKMLERCCHAYGTHIDKVLHNADKEEDLGEHYGDHVYEAEIRYMINDEWARTLDDIIWRRSKLGLHISSATKLALKNAIPALVKEMIHE